MLYEEQYKELYEELSDMEGVGLYLSLEGVQASAYQIVQAHVFKEPDTYMRDYVLNARGHIQEVCFERLN